MSWQNKLRKVEPYQAGEQPQIKNLIKLNTNENPYSPGIKVKEAILNFDSSQLLLYPNPDADHLKHSIARYHGLKDEQVFLGNGSDEVLALTFLTCFNGTEPLLFPDITYSFYPVYCDLYGIDFQMIALNNQFEIVKEDYYQKNSGIIFPNPNAPTGVLVSLEFIEDILQHNQESVVVIDEAYIDFGGQSAVPLLEKYDNLLIIQTFSKFRSLAGIRLGVALGNQEIISKLWTKKELKRLGFIMPDSYANFVFASHPYHKAEDLFMKLREKGILVRYFNKPRIDQYLRITIGTQSQMEKLIREMENIV